jgi:hypothetical protein
MADRRIKVLSHYYGGCDPHRKIGFCEPHPHALILILFNIILIIGQIHQPHKHGACSPGSASYNDLTSSMCMGLFCFVGDLGLFCHAVRWPCSPGFVFLLTGGQKNLACIYKL